MHPFLQEWSNWRPSKSPPYLLDGDRDALLESAHAKRYIVHRTWSRAFRDEDFGAPGDTKLHLGLYPHPFCGDLRRASIYILMLNPGLSATDYFGELKVPGFRQAIRRNLRQRFRKGASRFMFLDPRYSWHSGFWWWNNKLADVIQAVSTRQKWTFTRARKYLARHIASIELFPYHSASFASGRWIKSKHRLRSVELALDFVATFCKQRVEAGQAIVVATRRAELWPLPAHPAVIKYGSHEARSAHLTTDSKGGKAILQRLLDDQ